MYNKQDAEAQIKYTANTFSILSESTNLTVIDNNDIKKNYILHIQVKRLTGGEVQR